MFLIQCSILDIRQGSEYTEYDFRICQSYEYTRVLNMSGLHKALNNIFHDRCLAVL